MSGFADILTFDEEHAGDDGHQVTPDGLWVFFSDGCRRSIAVWGAAGHEMVTPQPGSKECRQWQKLFWETRLEALVADFENRKRWLKDIGDRACHEKEVAALRELQTQVRSARTKLSRLATQERGYTMADVERAWECWNEFSQAVAAESQCRQKYESLLLGRSSPGRLEKAKHAYDQAQRAATRAMERWNSFEPEEARSIVAQELDEQKRRERQEEIDAIEV
ncbi:MAG: hypothetical protein RBS99_19620 [Rhodospirillales bacterium]|jgi:hypothetical protein|nr:hypothetical protein [Rhodospirillales bacterium]